MEHTKGILFECNLSEEEINTIIEALSRDYVDNDPEILEKEYQLQEKIRKIISTFFVIFFSYYQDFFCASFVIFSLIILNLLIFCLCFKYFIFP